MSAPPPPPAASPQDPPRAEVAALSFERVAARYAAGDDVLRDVSFCLRAGSFHFVRGPSGAGKSTLLRLIRMELSPSQGRVLLFGRDVARLSRTRRAEMRRRFGVVFQDFHLLPGLSVMENVTLPLVIAGEATRTAERKAHELLEWVGLGARARAFPETLSGGERQCAAIARAVIARPEFLLADEPTGSVDAATARRLLFLFRGLHELGTGVLFATHDASLSATMRFPSLILGDGGVRLEPVPQEASPQTTSPQASPQATSPQGQASVSPRLQAAS